MIAIYARQSLDKKDSISIETQIEFCKKEAPAGTEFEIYQDKGFSGKNTNRPAFTKLFDDVKNGRIEKLIVYRLDRISRSITDFAGIMDFLQENNVDFVSSTEKFDTSTPMGRAMLYIVMVFAQLERETIAERVKDNYYARGKLGVWVGGPAPFGFKNDKTKLNGKTVSTITPTEDIELIKYIFDTYAYTHKALGAIARDIRQNTGEMWNNIKLSRMIQNPAYVKADVDVYNFYKAKKCILVDDIEKFDGTKGCNLYGKRNRSANKYRNLEEHVLSLSLHDGVIDSQTWLACQQKIVKNVQIKNTGKGKHTWLTGLVKCGYCGYSLRTVVGQNYRYLRCSGRYAKDGVCADTLTTHYINETEHIVDNAVIEYINNHKQSEINGINTAPEHANEKNTLKMRLAVIDEQIENLINSLAQMGSASQKYINERLTKLDSERAEILNLLNDMTVENQPIKVPTVEEWLSKNREEKHQSAAQLIDKIYVYNDEIKIAWKL